MIRIFGATDQGQVRTMNQDAFVYEVIDENTAYAVLCDGMGGENGGQVASNKSVEIIGAAISRALKPTPSPSSIKSIFLSAVTAANAVLCDMGEADEDLKGMGTTVVAAIVMDDMLYLTHAGDSRAYMLKDTPKGELLEQLTKDHSVVQLLLDGGEITEEEALTHPKRNYITRALGVTREIDAEYTEVPFASGSRVLLCSDGLYNFAVPHTHMDLIRSCESEQDLFFLVDEANKMGGRDNITAIIIAKP